MSLDGVINILAKLLLKVHFGQVNRKEVLSIVFITKPSIMAYIKILLGTAFMYKQQQAIPWRHFQRNVQSGLPRKQKIRYPTTQLLTKTRLIEHRFLLIDECTNLAAKLVEGLSGYATDGNICNSHSY